jgi:hypothetical protein
MPNIPTSLAAQVRERAAGRCEYCLVPEAFMLNWHEVDHIVSIKHDGPTTLERESGLIEPRSAIGRVTVRILQLNRPARVSVRAALLRQGLMAVEIHGQG